MHISFEFCQPPITVKESLAHKQEMQLELRKYVVIMGKCLDILTDTAMMNEIGARTNATFRQSFK